MILITWKLLTRRRSMVDWCQDLPNIVKYLCICLCLRTWRKLRPKGDASCIGDLPSAFEPLYSKLLIRLGQQPIRTD